MPLGDDVRIEVLVVDAGRLVGDRRDRGAPSGAAFRELADAHQEDDVVLGAQPAEGDRAVRASRLISFRKLSVGFQTRSRRSNVQPLRSGRRGMSMTWNCGRWNSRASW